jgi:flagellar biosynthesis protein FlhF
MQYFTEQAPTHREVMEKIQAKYGDRAKILTQKSVRMGGFMGMFAREGVEIAGYLSQEPLKTKRIDIEDEKRKILKEAKGEQTLLQVLQEVQAIKLKIENDYQHPRSEESVPSIEQLEEIMSDNDFSPAFTAKIVNRLKQELAFEDLRDARLVQATALNWIGEEIGLFREKPVSAPRIVILVGPTGVGKTTTIAKLAAIYGIGSSRRKSKVVRMLTIDNYRIGAKNQIETYGEIMSIPVSCVETIPELRKKLALYQDVDLILVDTIGKSPKDYTKLAEMRELLDACGEQAEIYLAMSATTKTSDIREIVTQFEPFKYRAVVLTKLDETMRVGNVISVLAEKQKPLIYFTTGQNVPQDMERASVPVLLRHLEGFKANWDYIDKKFSKSGSAENEEGVKAAEWR